MSKFYDEAYKWSLYMQYLGGRTLTQLCDAMGITDKPLRKWFKQFDAERLQVGGMTVVMLHQRHKRQREILQQQHTELAIIQKNRCFRNHPRGASDSLRQPLIGSVWAKSDLPYVTDQKIQPILSVISQTSNHCLRNA